MPYQHADRISFGGDVLTMDAADKVVDAIAIKEGVTVYARA